MDCTPSTAARGGRYWPIKHASPHAGAILAGQGLLLDDERVGTPDGQRAREPGEDPRAVVLDPVVLPWTGRWRITRPP
jgi:hypothetical protein